MRLWRVLWASTREYRDKAGRRRKVRTRVGAIFRDESSGRLAVKLEAVPVGDGWRGWLAALEPGDDAEAEQDEQEPGEL